MASAKTLKELERYGKALASRLKPGDVVGLVGELGSGKTALVQIIGKHLGVKTPIQSPTYLIQKIYPLGRKNQLVHIDAYRLKKDDDAENLSLEELRNDNRSIIIIEWADKIKDILPRKTIWIKLG